MRVSRKSCLDWVGLVGVAMGNYLDPISWGEKTPSTPWVAPFPRQENLNCIQVQTGCHLDRTVGKDPCASKPNNPSSVPGKYMAGGENQGPQVALWSHYAMAMCTCTHREIKTWQGTLQRGAECRRGIHWFVVLTVSWLVTSVSYHFDFPTRMNCNLRLGAEPFPLQGVFSMAFCHSNGKQN